MLNKTLATNTLPATTSNLEGELPASTNLSDALLNHAKWASSNGKLGKPLNFHLWDLVDADFSSANLAKANFRGADLRGANFKQANLTDAILTDANLEGANLLESIGLIGEQLAGANLRRAKVPEDIAKFEGLKNVEELAKTGGKLLLTLFVTTAFVFLTFQKTGDVQLLTDFGTEKLPVLDVDISVRSFFLLSPIVLIGLYISFHLYLKRLWEALAVLPAIFPDGVTVDRKSHPWLLSDLVCKYFPQLSKHRTPLLSFQNALFTFLAYWFIPITMLPVWAKSLPRRDWLLTETHDIIISLIIGVTMIFYNLTSVILRHQIDDYNSKHTFHFLKSPIIFTVTSAIMFNVFSWSAFNGVPRDRYIPHRQHGPNLNMFAMRRWVPRFLEEVGSKPFVNFDNADVSVKPQSWIDSYSKISPSTYQNIQFYRRANLNLDLDDNEIAQVKPAQLNNSDLRYAYANYAFLVRASLHNAILDHANMNYSDLRNANLSNARLYGTNLSLALLSRVDLRSSNLQDADFSWSDMRNSELRSANMSYAFLINANMAGALLSDSNLSDADLSYTNLRNAAFLRANLKDANLTGACLQGADMQGADFTNANFTEADLSGTVLSGANFTNANFYYTNLKGSDMRGAIWKNADLKFVIWDKKTKLPPNLFAIHKNYNLKKLKS